MKRISEYINGWIVKFLFPIAIGFCCFILMFGFDLLSRGNIEWLKQEDAQLKEYLIWPNFWPGINGFFEIRRYLGNLITHHLNDYPLSIYFFKLFYANLSFQKTQFIGLWLLLFISVQCIFIWKLLGEKFERILILALGTGVLISTFQFTAIVFNQINIGDYILLIIAIAVLTGRFTKNYRFLIFLMAIIVNPLLVFILMLPIFFIKNNKIFLIGIIFSEAISILFFSRGISIADSLINTSINNISLYFLLSVLFFIILFLILRYKKIGASHQLFIPIFSFFCLQQILLASLVWLPLQLNWGSINPNHEHLMHNKFWSHVIQKYDCYSDQINSLSIVWEDMDSIKSNCFFIVGEDHLVQLPYKFTGDENALFYVDHKFILAPEWKIHQSGADLSYPKRVKFIDAKPLKPNDSVKFSLGSDGLNYILHYMGGKILDSEGWYEPEQWGVWSNGGSSKLHFPISQQEQIKSITIVAHSILPKGRQQQEIGVYVNGAYIRDLIFKNNKAEEFYFNLSNLNLKGAINIEFRTYSPVKPIEIELSSQDHRQLGIGLHEIKFH